MSYGWGSNRKEGTQNMIKRTEKLPGDFENRYKSESLKDEIADIGMWGMIPAVTYKMDSSAGIKRLEKIYIM